MSDVTPLRTGRSPLDVTVSWSARTSGAETVSAGSARVQYPAMAGARDWVRSRNEVLRLAAFSGGMSSTEAGRAARMALCIWALESGWGESEWRWNAWGAHCYGSYDCQRDGLREALAAFRDLAQGSSAWWTRALRDPTIARAFRAGELGAVTGLYQSSERGPAYNAGTVISSAEARSLLARVDGYLAASGVVSTSGRRSSGGSTGILWLAVIAAALVAASGVKQ